MHSILTLTASISKHKNSDCARQFSSQQRSYGHCSKQQLGQQLCGTVVAAQCWTDTALTFCCSGGGQWQPWSSGLVAVSSLHSSFPIPNRPTCLRGR